MIGFFLTVLFVIFAWFMWKTLFKEGAIIIIAPFAAMMFILNHVLGMSFFMAMLICGVLMFIVLNKAMNR